MVEKYAKKFRLEIYTSLSDVEKEITRRWNDKQLRKKVEDFFGTKMLDILNERPRAVLSRSIGTPNLELKYFLDLTKEVGLDPLILEYDDKFVSKNKDKYHLGKLFFSRRLKNNKIVSVDTLKIVDFNKDEGKYFNNIKTVWGESIIDFHHKLLQSEVPELKDKILNFSEWFNETRESSDFYYLYYLSLFVCHGVLFENFLVGDKQERSFINEKFLPSFREVERLFGVKPLIYPLLPFEEENNPYPFWCSYPEDMEMRIGVKMRKRKNKFVNFLRHYWFALRNMYKHA